MKNVFDKNLIACGLLSSFISLLSNIPTHFICYLLKLVYAIISECSTKSNGSSNSCSESNSDSDQQMFSDGILSNILFRSNSKPAQNEINTEKVIVLLSAFRVLHLNVLNYFFFLLRKMNKELCTRYGNSYRKEPVEGFYVYLNALT